MPFLDRIRAASGLHFLTLKNFKLPRITSVLREFRLTHKSLSLLWFMVPVGLLEITRPGAEK